MQRADRRTRTPCAESSARRMTLDYIGTFRGVVRLEQVDLVVVSGPP